MMAMIDNQTKMSVIDRLHREKCSCVISNGCGLTVCHERGVMDLYRLLTQEPERLRDTFVADKVVGKGAAALMILGGVRELYADLISRPALGLLDSEGVEVSFADVVPNILNRTQTGFCPVETLCSECRTAAQCLPLIEKFINQQIKTKSE